MGILFVVGIGPGNAACLTEAARRALDACDVIIGYARYTELI
ncbi:MAG TPA: precorrin-3B C(17)-methyltransferase, partial [Candidatus Treponema faecavium]|nr:precorrin-3B C(17)-methyltransferase [Candidatus Treponema faecavium]